MREDFAAAEPLEREVVETLSGIRAEDDRFHLAALNNWASILEAKGELAEAERVFRKVLAGRGRTLGDAHPETVQSLSNLAKLLHARGEPDQAATLLRTALDRLDAAPDTNPLERAVVTSNLAVLLADGGERALAEALLRDTVKRASAVAPPDHPHLLGLQTNLGVFLVEGEDSAGAEPYLEAAAAGYARAFGREHPLAQRATIALAAAYDGQGQRERAKALLLEIAVSGDHRAEQADDTRRPQLWPASALTPEAGANLEDAAAFTALANAHHYDDLYALTERFAFVTSVDFIARLEEMAGDAPLDVAGALLERAALLRHLAAGKPLTTACNPLIEAFHALSQSQEPQDEAMLVRLYPFLCSRQVLQAMREMAASAGDARAAVALDRLARRFESRAEGKRTN